MNISEKARLKSLLKSVISPFYEKHKMEIYGVYLAGSASYPYLDSYHDLDVLFILYEATFQQKNQIEIAELKLELENIFKLKVDFICREISFFDDIKKFDVFEPKLRFPVILYLEHEPILGNLIETDLQDIDILQPKNKDKMWRFFSSGGVKIKRHYSLYGILPQEAYHVLIATYIVDNNSYDLTEQQIDNVNKLHNVTPQSAFACWEMLSLEMKKIKLGEDNISYGTNKEKSG